MALLIGASPKEIVFTSGATESNNLAIKGVAEFYGKRRNHIITTVTEHKCVLDSCRRLEELRDSNGEKLYQVTYLGVKENGIIDLDAVCCCSFFLFLSSSIDQHPLASGCHYG